MRNSFKTSPDAKRIKTEQHALYYSGEIPYQFWGACHTPSFRTFKAGDTFVSETRQQDVWNRVSINQDDVLSHPKLLCVCVEHNEDLALDVAFHVGKLALDQGHTIQVTNACDMPNFRDLDVTDPVSVLYNVSVPMTVDRRQSIRDWVYSYKASFRILVSVADPDNLINALGLTPSYVLYVSHMKRVQA